ncbi:hypothetical protein C0J52_20529 [Blattella germanica]|nr:hypothetical protein C0J52_20529 [Blattella germanica]
MPSKRVIKKRTDTSPIRNFRNAIKDGRIRDVQEGLKRLNIFVQLYDGDEGSPLHDAVFSNQLNIVKILLDRGAMLNYIDPVTQETAIHWAAKYGHLEILKHIASNDDFLEIKDGTASQNTPIHTATNYGKIDVIKWLVTVKRVSVNSFNKSGYTPLLSAVRREDSYLTQELINLGADVDCRSKDTEGMTPLHLAVKCGAENIVWILLVSGASTQTYCHQYGYTPLHWAVRLGMLEILKLIHSHNRDLSCQTKDVNGHDPTHLAAMFGHVHIMKWLVRQRCLLDKPNKRGWTPLHVSVEFNQCEIVDFLIRKGMNLQIQTLNKSMTALHIAARLGLDDMVSFLLSKGSDVNAENEKGLLPLHYAVKNNNVTCVKMLFNVAATLIKSNDKESYRILFMASTVDAADSMRFLIQNGIKIDLRDSNKYTPLHISACNGSLNTTRILLEKGANVNARNNKLKTPLHLAVHNGHCDVIRLLLQFGADVAAICSLGHNAAHYAAVKNNLSCLQLLVSAGCDLNVFSKDGAPIHIAAFLGHTDIVSLLLENGVSVNATGDFSITPLILAISECRYETSEFLIRNKADVNLFSYSTEHITPLHMAAMLGDIRSIKLLIENKASVDLRSIKGDTPLILAVKNGHFDAAKELVHAGADINVTDFSGRAMFQYVKNESFVDQLREITSII